MIVNNFFGTALLRPSVPTSILGMIDVFECMSNVC